MSKEELDKILKILLDKCNKSIHWALEETNPAEKSKHFFVAKAYLDAIDTILDASI